MTRKKVFRVVECAKERRSRNPNQKKRSFKRVTATSHGSYAQPRGFRVVGCAEERRSCNPNQKKRSFKRVTATSHGSYAQPRGISSSALPYKRTPPSWLKISSQDVEENICKFAKKGLTPSQIGVILRDSHGIAQVNSVTGSKILRILKAHGLAPEIPEDLYHLIKKAVSIRKHLERNRKDKDSKFRLILVESRIHRLARYYKKTKKLPPVWKYESTTASTLGFRVVECAEERRSRNPNQKKRSFKRVTATSHGSYAQPRGISSSALPYKRTPPSWLKISSQDVEENICKFAKKGLTPSQIGVILRDSHGIAQVNSVTGSKILRILKAHGLAPEIPEDLYHLIKKAVSIRKHLERNRKDKDSKFRLILVESRIHRLARYYKKTKKLPPVWKYESTTASTLANS
ncbi:40S ribosomal protein S13 [Glycine max]|nr:40S ribosomal protein S13 [Glycine max]